MKILKEDEFKLGNKKMEWGKDSHQNCRCKGVWDFGNTQSLIFTDHDETIAFFMTRDFLEKMIRETDELISKKKSK